MEASTEKKISRQEKWAAKNPLATWAHASLRSALRRGLVEKGPCEICGAEDVDGHHDDYSQPAKVQWLCRAHHKAEHRRLKEDADVGE